MLRILFPFLMACTGDDPKDPATDAAPAESDAETDLASPDETAATTPQDVDGDGSPAAEDCDDADPGRRPGNPEYCDGRDNDCDAATTAEDHSVFLAPDGAVIDIAALLDTAPGGVFTTPGPGVIQLCPGDHSGQVVISHDDVVLRSAPGPARARLDGGTLRAVEVGVGLTGVQVLGVDLRGMAEDGGAVIVRESSDAMLDDLRVDGSVAEDCGGALFVASGAHVTLRGAALTGNKAFSGGAVYVDVGATLVAEQVTMDHNLAVEGGALVVWTGATLDATGLALRSNDAWLIAGGLDAQGCARVSCLACAWSDNAAPAGGAAMLIDVVEAELADFIEPLAGNQAEEGGALYVRGSGLLTLRGLTFDGSGASEAGGALSLGWVEGASLVDLRFRNGQAGTLGGGIHATSSELTLARCTFETNHAVEGGGGLYAIDSTLTLQDVAFDANDGSWPTSLGGGVRLSGGQLVATGTSWYDNFAEQGGALYVEGGAAVTIAGGSHGGNSAITDGGALYLASGHVMLDGGTWAGDRASDGGLAWVDAEGVLDMAGSLVSGHAAARGAVLYSAGALSLDACALHDNHATGGASLVELADGRVSIVASDLGTPLVDDNSSPELTSAAGSWSFAGVTTTACDPGGCWP